MYKKPTDIKVPQYLHFIRTKSCCVLGTWPVDAHHEHIFSGYNGAYKNHNDFQAVPLEHNLHLYGRHREGYAFWERVQVNPRQVAFQLLQEFVSVTRVDDYDSEEDYETVLRVAKRFIGVLQEEFIR